VGWNVAFADRLSKFSNTGGGGTSKLEIGRENIKPGAQKQYIGS
jgi:hypothetical protein